MKVKIGLALSSGGAKGFAHIGVIKSLEKNDIPIHVISGVSAGSLFGGIYASRSSIEEIEEVSYSTGYKEVAQMFWDFSRKIPGGLIVGAKIDNFLNSLLKNKRIENFPIKFSCMATDLLSGRSVHFIKGPASLAIRSSCAIPGIFKPIEYNRKFLVDGGVNEPISFNQVKKLGGNVNIAVDLTPSLSINQKIKENKKFGIKDSLYSSYLLMQKRFIDIKFKENKDFLRIKPQVNEIKFLDFGSPKAAKRGITEGEKVMDKNIPKLKKMIEIMEKK